MNQTAFETAYGAVECGQTLDLDGATVNLSTELHLKRGRTVENALFRFDRNARIVIDQQDGAVEGAWRNRPVMRDCVVRSTDEDHGWGIQVYGPHCKLDTVHVEGFWKGIELRTNAYLFLAQNCYIRRNRFGVYLDGPKWLLGGGENVSFMGGSISGNTRHGLVLKRCQVHLFGVSIDYNGTGKHGSGAWIRRQTRLSSHGCHWETNKNRVHVWKDYTSRWQSEGDSKQQWGHG